MCLCARRNDLNFLPLKLTSQYVALKIVYSIDALQSLIEEEKQEALTQLGEHYQTQLQSLQEHISDLQRRLTDASKMVHESCKKKVTRNDYIIIRFDVKSHPKGNRSLTDCKSWFCDKRNSWIFYNNVRKIELNPTGKRRVLDDVAAMMKALPAQLRAATKKITMNPHHPTGKLSVVLECNFFFLLISSWFTSRANPEWAL